MYFQDENGNIRVRPFQPDDVLNHFTAVRESMADLTAWMDWCREDYSEDDTRKFVRACISAWEQGSDYTFAILDARDGTHLGGIGLNHIQRDNNFANLGYWVRSSRTGRGVAAAAARMVAGFGLRELRLSRVEIVVAVGNDASHRVAQKLGAKPEGLMRNRVMHRGTPRDATMYSLIPADLKP